MSATLNNEPIIVDTSLDSIVLVNVLETLVGGRDLDLTVWGDDVLKAGLVVIKEDATNKYKPMPLNSEKNAYTTLPAGHSFVGVLGGTYIAKKAMCSIVVRGTINKVASPFPVTEEIVKALPLIRFVED